MIYMVCYDIANQKRLRKVSKILEGYGIRVQKSFFQCEMEKSRMERMKREILKTIRRKEDAFFVYPLCEDCAGKALTDGNGQLITISSYEIL
jgi:CRISPR-associated protein Cas2